MQALGAVLAWLSLHYRNHWVDPVTVLMALFYACMQRFRSSGAKPILSRQTGWDVMNGLALFPLVLLMGSAFSHYLTGQLLTTNKVIMFGAGMFSLCAILEDPTGT